GRVAHAAAGAERLLLDDVAQAHAEMLGLAERLLDVVHAVGAGEDDVGDAVLAQQRELPGEEGTAQQRHHRLGARQRERPQPRALTAGEDDGLGGARYGPGAQGNASLISITGMPSRIGYALRQAGQMMRVSSKRRSPLQAGHTRMALSSSSITLAP